MTPSERVDDFIRRHGDAGLRGAVLIYIASRGPFGATRREVADAVGTGLSACSRELNWLIRSEMLEPAGPVWGGIAWRIVGCDAACRCAERVPTGVWVGRGRLVYRQCDFCQAGGWAHWRRTRR